jgi:V/A-type H+-transporting ATPase subunit D
MQAFLASMHERVRYQDLFEEKTQQASLTLTEALAVEGSNGLAPYGWAARRDFALEARREVVWGIPVTTFRRTAFVRDFRKRGFDAAGAGYRVNRAADRFEELLALILDAAATDVLLKRLGGEIQKTTRRINAIEERIFPELERTEKRIREKLDEMAQDENQRMRRLTRRRKNRPKVA